MSIVYLGFNYEPIYNRPNKECQPNKESLMKCQCSAIGVWRHVFNKINSPSMVKFKATGIIDTTNEVIANISINSFVFIRKFRGLLYTLNDQS
jgi:hypothetical protein